MNTTVWFNQCFTTIHYTIAEYKKMFGNSIRLIGSSVNPEHVFKEACDEFYVEPDISGKEYCKWAANFCKEHSVDIFIVKKHRASIAKHIDLFIDAGVKTVVNNYDSQYIVDNKDSAYRFIADNIKDSENKPIIPEFEVVNSDTVTVTQLSELMIKYGKACYKLCTDEGAGSFRVLDNDVHKNRAKSFPSLHINVLDACKELNDLKDSHKVLVMEYLDNPEVSVDCYNSKNGFTTLVRKKISKRIEIIEPDERLEKQCEELQRLFNFKYPWNAQFRVNKNGEYALLEINPRMSGGSHLGLMCNHWLGEYLIKDLLNMDYEIKPYEKMKLGKIEGHVIL